jgi:hypothetical protein
MLKYRRLMTAGIIGCFAITSTAFGQPNCQPYTIQAMWTPTPLTQFVNGMDISTSGEAIIDSFAGPLQALPNGVLQRSQLLKNGLPPNSVDFATYNVTDIGPNGLIIGDFFSFIYSRRHAYVYTPSNRQSRDIHATAPSTSILTQFDSSQAEDINSNGDILLSVQTVAVGNASQVGLLIERDGTEHLIDPASVGETYLRPRMVNDAGEATGALATFSGAVSRPRPFRYSNGVLLDLGQACPTCTATTALAIDDQGTIHGYTILGPRFYIFEHRASTGYQLYNIASSTLSMLGKGNERGLLFGLTPQFEQQVFANGQAYRLLDLIQGYTGSMLLPVVQGSSSNGDLLVEYSSANGAWNYAYLKLNQWCF